MKASFHRLSLLLCLASQSWATPLRNREENLEPRAINYVVNQDRADAIKEAFLVGWDGYYKYAFPHDQLEPVTNGYTDPRNGWGATAVDALSTAVIMELTDVVDIITNFIPTVDFGYSSTEVDLFETNIRYVGGMLAAYDLLKGPFSNITSNSTNVDALLAQAQNLAGNLTIAFDTPTGIPDNYVWFTNHTTAGDTTNGLATIGTLVLEWTHLSDLTGNQTFADLTQHAESYLLNPEPPSSQPFPGLVGTNVALNNGSFLDAYGGWIGGDDSFYEYLIKMYVYDSSRFGFYKDRWTLAADSSIEYLASHPSSRTDLTFVAVFNGTQLVYESEHLACFAGGNFLLGGLALGEQKYVDFGLELVAGCHDTYVEDATGIGPEVFDWLPEACNSVGACGGHQKRDAAPQTATDSASESPTGYGSHTTGDSPVWPPPPTSSPQSSPPPSSTGSETTTGTATTSTCNPSVTLVPPYSNCSIPPEFANQTSFYEKSGFWITDATYDLRPEVLESIYYAYRVTGNTMYQDWSWAAFQAIISTTRVGSGYSQINNVNVPGGDGFTNVQESFLFAEVMKYAYLTQAADGPWQVNYQGKNQYVFNTEAHPLRVAGSPLP